MLTGSLARTLSGPVGASLICAVVIFALSADRRRMQETGRSGLCLLCSLIMMAGIASAASFMGGFAGTARARAGSPFFGGAGIFPMAASFVLAVPPLLILWRLPLLSRPGPNRYGPQPTR
ncbi:uncharacterized protein DUF805 [Rhodovulum imhoffii]|uniref:Uncharacterized protein DUF805 n=1 Tax=Rhodovulum imhoffii TaxID=365340 RepID=A0A2T5BRV8_9RHOB|nr:DUF805 domain-containing protein [Rhodovulum imhoffii]MBK5933272.1 hypothetical protein [Rhodovulum imhoffii]PTN02007.1 uncharacterized protein DUF805 [Rhodovulum imhoffii]